MGGLFLASTTAPDLTADALPRAVAQFTAHGFSATTPIALPGWQGLHAPFILGGPDGFLARGDDLCAVAGTIVVDRLMGRAALERLIDDIDPLRLDWSRLGGQFAVLLRRAGRTFLFTDYFGAFQLLHDSGRRLFSTSLLSALHALPRVAFDPQGVYEFAFNVAPIGGDTVFAGLHALGPDRIAELLPDGVRYHAVAKPLPRTADTLPMPERTERARARLHAIVAPHVAAFGDRIQCPLSGGLDSRLLLAALRAAGASPSLYVYGPPGSADVAIAQAIGAAEGTPVEWIEKGRAPLSPDAFPAHVAAEFDRGDALPNYGNIFDNGGNTAALEARHAGGRLAASGGCGEIYRDFFYLADRPRTARAVAATFFARFVAGDATAMFDGRVFLDRLAAKIAHAVDLPVDRPIPRQVIEQIYPRIRCGALFGREISMEARHGAYLMPFLDHGVVADAMTLPVGLKRAGRFEAQLLAAIDPALAAHPSAYGHDFAGSPSRRHRLQEWSTRIRPIWLRQRSYAIQRRLRPLGDEHGGLLSPDYMHRVIDPDFPAMRRYFRMDHVTDSGLYRRIACLEYLAARLGSRLAA
ncbi:hypothetical protein [Sphingomonas sp.]|uniref:hypothetical protein n=1 Tax=Sphingomonas sp. TaxID=28214 RepID=UPI003AFFCA27